MEFENIHEVWRQSERSLLMPLAQQQTTLDTNTSWTCSALLASLTSSRDTKRKTNSDQLAGTGRLAGSGVRGMSLSIGERYPACSKQSRSMSRKECTMLVEAGDIQVVREQVARKTARSCCNAVIHSCQHERGVIKKMLLSE